MPVYTSLGDVYDIRKFSEDSPIERTFKEAYDASIPKEIEDHYIDLANSIKNYMTLCEIMSQINVANSRIERGLDKIDEKGSGDKIKNEKINEEYKSLKTELLEALNNDDLPKIIELSPVLQSISAKLSASNKTVQRNQENETELRSNHMSNSVGANDIRARIAKIIEKISESLADIKQSGVDIENTGITEEIFDKYKNELPRLDTAGTNSLMEALDNYIEMRKAAFKNVEMIASNIVENYNKRHELIDALSDKDINMLNDSIYPLVHYWIQDYLEMPENGFADRLQVMADTLGLLSSHLKGDMVDEAAQEILANHDSMDVVIKDMLTKMATIQPYQYTINKG